jgi:hypothetical protein
MLRTAIYFLLTLAAISCKKEAVFRADPVDDRLPEYSQEGRNIAGALINDQAWRSEFLNLYSISYNPLRIYSSTGGDSTIFEFSGRYFSPIYQPMAFRAIIKGLRMSNIDSLGILSGKTFVLDADSAYWLYDDTSYVFSSSKGKGRLSILHVQPNKNVFYNENGILRNPYIVAGTFEITFSGPVNYNVTDGRFDMQVRPGNEFVAY